MASDGSTTPETWVDVVAPDACALGEPRVPNGLVAAGLIVAELHSDKAMMEITSPVDGELVWLRRAGDELRPGEVIARVRRGDVPGELRARVLAQPAPPRARDVGALAAVGVVAALVPAVAAVALGVGFPEPSLAPGLWAVAIVALASGVVATRWPRAPWVLVAAVGVGCLSLWAETRTSPVWVAGVVALWGVANLATWQLDRAINPPARRPPSAPSA